MDSDVCFQLALARLPLPCLNCNRLSSKPVATTACRRRRTQDIDSKRSGAAAASEELDAGLAAASASQVESAKGAAQGALAALLLSDAPLLYPPGQLALAALRSGCASVQVSIPRYVQHVAEKASEVRRLGSLASPCRGVECGMFM